MSSAPSSDSSPVIFVDGVDSSILGPDSTTRSVLLLDDESSEINESGGYLDESLLYLSAQSQEDFFNRSCLLDSQNETLEKQNYEHSPWRDGSTLESPLEDSTQCNFVSNSPLSQYLIIDSPVSRSTPRQYKRKRSRSTERSHTCTSPRRHNSQLLTKSCCTRKCLTHLSLAEMERSQKRFCTRTLSEQNQFLLDSFQISRDSSDQELSGMLEGKHLCCEAFTSVLNISQKRYKSLHDQYKDGVLKYQRKPITRAESTKVSEAKAWMNRFFHQIGDHMPHIQRIHLPHFLTKRDVYVRMKSELVSQGIDEMKIVSLSWFYKIWEKSFSKVLIPEVSLLLILYMTSSRC